MPVNFTQEYLAAEQRFHEARSIEGKISCLEEMLRTLPRHKGSENLRAQLNARLSKLKKEGAKKKKGARAAGIAKEGEAQVCLVGKTMSGKSLILRKITNAKPRLAAHEYTTTKPEIGMMDWNGVKIQIVEIPATMEPRFLSIARSAELVAITGKDTEEVRGALKDNFIRTRSIAIFPDDAPENIKEMIWKALGMILVYTKKTRTPMALKHGSTVRNFCERIHKDFLRNFSFAFVWRDVSGKERRIQAGLKYRLQDGDVVEIHAK